MAKTNLDYTGLSQELAQVMASLEQGDLGVDAAVAAYERGSQIVAVLEKHLQKAENKVNTLKAAHDVAADELEA